MSPSSQTPPGFTHLENRAGASHQADLVLRPTGGAAAGTSVGVTKVTAMNSWWKRALRGDELPMLTAEPSQHGAGPLPGAVRKPLPGPEPVPAPTNFATRAGAATLSGAELRARAATIRRTKLREGYDLAQVDELLDRAAAALDAHAAGRVGLIAATDVLAAKFQATKFREGYDQDKVDDLLDLVVAALRR